MLIAAIETGRNGIRKVGSSQGLEGSRGMRARRSAMLPPPSFGAKIRTDFIAGMGKVNGRFVILLDVDQVLSIDEMSLLAETAGADA